MRRGLALISIALAAIVGVPASASADSGDIQIAFSFNDGWFYPQGADVDFGFFCFSETVAIYSCDATQPRGSKLDTFLAGTHTITVTATDWPDFNQTSVSQSYTVVDITKPHVVFRAPTADATYDQGSFVAADYSCEDDAGGLGMLEGACVGLPVGTPLDTSRVGTFSFWVDAFDRAFNHDAEVVHYTVVDRTPPAITITSPAAGATYTLGQFVTADFGCEDREGSGVSTCKGSTGWGVPLNTSSVGARTFTVTATDRAGNTAQAQSAYSVVYDFSGFASPASTYPAATSVKPGENVPLKFSLHGDQGADVVAAVGWTPCGASDGPATAQGTLSYNASNDRYTYAAATSKFWAGSCRDFALTLRDGTTHRARFTFTK